MVLNTNPVLDAFRDSFDAYDAWGSVLGAHFDIAECLYRNDVEVPEEWQFRPSPLLEIGDELDEDSASYFAAQIEVMITQGHVRNILHAGNVLARYAHLLKLAGEDY